MKMPLDTSFFFFWRFVVKLAAAEHVDTKMVVVVADWHEDSYLLAYDLEYIHSMMMMMMKSVMKIVMRMLMKMMTFLCKHGGPKQKQWIWEFYDKGATLWHLIYKCFCFCHKQSNLLCFLKSVIISRGRHFFSSQIVSRCLHVLHNAAQWSLTASRNSGNTVYHRITFPSLSIGGIKS